MIDHDDDARRLSLHYFVPLFAPPIDKTLALAAPSSRCERNIESANADLKIREAQDEIFAFISFFFFLFFFYLKRFSNDGERFDFILRLQRDR